MRKTCSRRGCFADRNDGDTYFCRDCRENYVNALKRRGLAEAYWLTKEQANDLLQKFINKELR